ncbi:hypothetical protein CVT25_009870 [Psilocybe cyanescens]|uniref:Uncharacterized protein n=1 Tax=Psilocybe cyanescens TaxID=93625 RepID=A0A409XT63_PSICY|nr:hypothetical protein CVT25_009870 [Psilocybe cyanescens]
MDAATTKFEQAIAFAILPVSSELAALHTSRTRSHSHLYSCFRCGTDLTTSGTRLVRSKRSATRPLHVLSTSCHACGEIALTPVDTGNAGRYPPCRKSSQIFLSKHVTQKRAPSPSSAIFPKVPSPSPAKLPIPNLTPNLQVYKTSKKKFGLQQMLQRNREKEQKRTQTEAAKPAGLSAFLSTL